jgi:hypothetical protein
VYVIATWRRLGSAIDIATLQAENQLDIKSKATVREDIEKRQLKSELEQSRKVEKKLKKAADAIALSSAASISHDNGDGDDDDDDGDNPDHDNDIGGDDSIRAKRAPSSKPSKVKKSRAKGKTAAKKATTNTSSSNGKKQPKSKKASTTAASSKATGKKKTVKKEPKSSSDNDDNDIDNNDQPVDTSDDI